VVALDLVVAPALVAVLAPVVLVAEEEATAARAQVASVVLVVADRVDRRPALRQAEAVSPGEGSGRRSGVLAAAAATWKSSSRRR
jgi:hypothetical protein